MGSEDCLYLNIWRPADRRGGRPVIVFVHGGTRGHQFLHQSFARGGLKRGIGAALKWSEDQFRRYSRDCGGCLEVGRASQVMEGRRLTGPTP